MKFVLASGVALLAASAQASVVFLISTEKNGQGDQGGGVTNRWVCHELEPPLLKNASWAFVASGLANGCYLYADPECNDKGAKVFIEKNNSNILGPGPVNLTDVEFDKQASSWQCF